MKRKRGCLAGGSRVTPRLAIPGGAALTSSPSLRAIPRRAVGRSRDRSKQATPGELDTLTLATETLIAEGLPKRR